MMLLACDHMSRTCKLHKAPVYQQLSLFHRPSWRPFSNNTGVTRECATVMKGVRRIMSIVTGNRLRCLPAHCRLIEAVVGILMVGS